MKSQTPQDQPADGRGVIRATLVSKQEMGRALSTVAPAFVELVRSMPDDAAQQRVPGSHWTAAEVAAHVITVAGRGLGDNRRAATVAELAELNQTCIAEIDERTPARLAERLAATFAASAATARDPDTPFELHAGVISDIVTATSYLLADLLVHGDDISRATGRPWTVEPGPAATALRAALPAMAPWVRPAVLDGARTSVVLDFGDGGPPIEVSVGDGAYRAGAAKDHHPRTVSAPADDVLLALTKRRESDDADVAAFAAWYLPI